MKNVTNTRAAARSAATAAKTTEQTPDAGKRRPAPPEASDNTTETVAEAAPVVAPDPIPLVVIAPNPKRAGSIAHGFFAKYGPTCKMTTFEAVREAGVRGKDVAWDRDRRHILMGDEAKNFPCDGTREEQATYLKGLNSPPTEKQLIAWGYVDAPKEEPKADAKADEKVDEKATA